MNFALLLYEHLKETFLHVHILVEEVAGKLITSGW
jgi:hypothetical protein